MNISWNPMQPIRPRKKADGEPLQYRTHITKRDALYQIYNPTNMICQLKLYHWCRSLEYRTMVPMMNLRNYLMFDYPNITKRSLGMTAMQTVPYTYRLLKGVTLDNPHATMCYAWRHPEELQYGLEWMLSTWIWKLEVQFEDIRELPPEEMAKITEKVLDELAACEDHSDVHGLFCEPVINGEFMDSVPLKELDWPTLWDKFGWTEEGRQYRSPKPGGLGEFTRKPEKRRLIPGKDQ